MSAEDQTPLAAFRCLLKWCWLSEEGFNEVKRCSSAQKLGLRMAAPLAGGSSISCTEREALSL